MSRFCYQCGAMLRDGARFCGKCGSKVRSVEMPVEPPVQEVPEEKLSEKVVPMPLTGILELTEDEMETGCRIAADFGTGKIFEIRIPGNLSEGQTVIVHGTNARAEEYGEPSDIELTVMRK